MARRVRRGVIVAKIKPGSEEKVAEMFAESDREGELPSIMGRDSPQPVRARDVYIHYVEMEEDLAKKVDEQVGDDRFRRSAAGSTSTSPRTTPRRGARPRTRPGARVLHLGRRSRVTLEEAGPVSKRAISSARAKRCSARSRPIRTTRRRWSTSAISRSARGTTDDAAAALPPGARARAREHRCAAGDLDHPRPIGTLGGRRFDAAWAVAEAQPGGSARRRSSSPTSRSSVGRLDEA